VLVDLNVTEGFLTSHLKGGVGRIARPLRETHDPERGASRCVA
jgi:hypothetical protein